ncbi:MAG: hypothetical protein JWM80_3547 [Cyanobacteria bacterium RYN_339]|nr:hypothetical protein [Cyanobacteria bacterium RYN_339]
MTVKRIRTLRATIGLATAVALSVGVSGCQLASFNPNAPAGNPAGTNPAASTTTPSGNNTTTVTPANPVANSKPTVLKGLATLSKGPMANAQLRVEDAITGKPLGIVAAGGGNIIAQGAGNIVAQGAGNIVAQGAGNYRAHRHITQATTAAPTTTALATPKPKAAAAPKLAALVQTDGAGQFKLAVLGLAPGKVARIIATANGKTVTCLITGSGKTLDKNIKKKAAPYHHLQTDDGFANVNDPNAPGDFNASDLTALDNAPSSDAYMDPITSALDDACSAMLALDSNLKDPTEAIDKAMDKAAEKGDDLQAAFDKNPALEDKMCAGDGDLSGGDMQALLAEAGVLDDFQADFKTVAQEYSAAASAGGVLSGGGFDPGDFDSIGVGLTAGGDFSVGGEVIDIPGDSTTPGDTPNPPNPGDPIPPDENTGASDDDAASAVGATLGHPVFTSTDFQPDVNIYENSGTVTIDVTQPSGEDDIKQIVARFRGDVFAFSGTGILGSGSTDATKAIAGGGLVVTNSTVPGAPTAFPNLELPDGFGGTVFTSGGSQSKFKGYLVNGSVAVAYFQVFYDGTFTYVVTNYALSDSFELTTSGHKTRLTTPHLNIAGGGDLNAEVIMTSRNDNQADRVDAISTSTPPSPGP